MYYYVFKKLPLNSTFVNFEYPLPGVSRGVVNYFSSLTNQDMP